MLITMAAINNMEKIEAKPNKIIVLRHITNKNNSDYISKYAIYLCNIAI
jgi:hypothetical protein